ncbi:MAG: cytochrome c [Candidatus Nanopelagicales bacterium]
MKKRSRRRSMAAGILMGSSLLLVGSGYAVVSAETTPAPEPTSADSVEQIQLGRQLFLEGCSSCHGLEGQGIASDNATGGNGGPTLIGVGEAAVDFQVSTGRMPLAVPEAQAPRKEPLYSQAEIAALAAYVATLGPGPANPTEEQLNLDNANIAEGGEIFRTNCTQCHNFAGSGGALTDGQYAPSLMNATPKQMWQAMVTGPQQMPVFSNETITDEDKKNLIAYVQALKVEPNPGGLDLGRLGPVAEGLFAWTAGLIALIGVAVWIGAKVR